MRATLQEDRRTFRESLSFISQTREDNLLATHCLSVLYSRVFSGQYLIGPGSLECNALSDFSESTKSGELVLEHPDEFEVDWKAIWQLVSDKDYQVSLSAMKIVKTLLSVGTGAGPALDNWVDPLVHAFSSEAVRSIGLSSVLEV